MRKLLTILLLAALIATPSFAALTASTIAEVETGGNDTNNGGLFDPSQTAGMFTDGAATVANTSAPVFTSASYNFVAGDVGAWVYIASGTNWTAGWYKISSVASNAATLDATIGHGVLKPWPITPTTVVGCATTASPTAATWTIDYSQQSAVKFSYTDLASAGTGLTVSSAAHPFGKQYVGNSLVITSGTNFNAGRYVIASISGTTATVVGAGNITTGAGASGVGGMGGALASPGQAGNSSLVSGATIFIQTGTYTVTTASTNVAAGCLSLSISTHIEGYGTVRGDQASPPTILAGNAISTFVLIKATAGHGIWANLILDGAGLTSGQGINASAGYLVYKVLGQNFTNSAFATSAGAFCLYCKATTNSTVAAIITYVCVDCEAYSNTFTGFTTANSGALCIRCLSHDNSGATSDGFLGATSGAAFINSIAYNNGRDGFRLSAADGNWINNIAENNTGIGFNANALAVHIAYGGTYNNSGGSTSLTTSAADINLGSTPIVASSSFFVNAAGGNFALNNTTAAGQLARAVGIPGVSPVGATTGYLDLGFAQHADPPISSPISQ